MWSWILNFSQCSRRYIENLLNSIHRIWLEFYILSSAKLLSNYIGNDDDVFRTDGGSALANGLPTNPCSNSILTINSLHIFPQQHRTLQIHKTQINTNKMEQWQDEKFERAMTTEEKTNYKCLFLAFGLLTFVYLLSEYTSELRTMRNKPLLVYIEAKWD